MISGRYVLVHRGDFSRPAVVKLFHRLESILMASGEPPVTQKGIFQIVVEAVENIVLHQSGKMAAHDRPAFGLFRRGTEYSIVTSNRMSRAGVALLKSRVDQLNQLDRVGLKMAFLGQMNMAPTSPRGNAGLGLMRMARKSGTRIQYQFLEEPSDFPRFNLKVTINRTTPVELKK